MKKTKQQFTILEYVILALLLLYLVGSVISGFLQPNIFAAGQEQVDTTTAHAEYESDMYGTTHVTITDVEWTHYCDTLLFYCNHQEVYVYADGSLVYSRLKTRSIFGTTSGASWNFVDVPEGTEKVVIELHPVYAVVKDAEIDFSVGNGTHMMYDCIANSVVSMIICFFLIGIGLSLVIYYFIAGHPYGSLKDLLFLGMFSAILGIWSFLETDAGELLVKSRILGTFAGYSAIVFLGITSVLYMHYFFKTSDKYVYRIICGYGVFALVLGSILQAMHIVDFRAIAPILQAPVGLAAIYWIYATIVGFRKTETRHKAIINAIGIIAMMLPVTIDFYQYYKAPSIANRAGKLGFLIYVLLLGIESAKDSRRIIDEQRMLSVYREMATKDMLTNCNNRNSFNQDIENLAPAEGLSFVTIDLNNLKTINDTLGHAEGDRYLMDASRIIRTIFGKYGKIYRIGGDEFCVVIKDGSVSLLKQLDAKLSKTTRYFEEQHPNYHLGLACGFAIFDGTRDQSVEDVRFRADDQMYQNKRNMKGN